MPAALDIFHARATGGRQAHGRASGGSRAVLVQLQEGQPLLPLNQASYSLITVTYYADVDNERELEVVKQSE